MKTTRTWRNRLAGPALALLGLTLLLPGVARAQTGYGFKAIAVLGDPAPGGSKFTNDFEPSRLNNNGDLAFTADLTDKQQEGVFLASGGQILPILRYGQAAPGGGTFGAAEFGFLGLNDTGDMAIAFSLEPFPTTPYGVGTGLYRWSRQTQSLSPVVVPRVTAAPGGVNFAGVWFNVALNNRGEVTFTGLTATDKGVHILGEDYVGFAKGVYVADAQGQITPAVSPGEAAPGGSTFDLAQGVLSNDQGDVAFAGHRASDPCGPQLVPQATEILCNSNVYVRRAATGRVETIARAGDPMPGGGAFVTGVPAGLNNAGDVLFINTLNPAVLPPINVLFLHSGGSVQRVAGPGDTMPGGGKISLIANAALNNRGDVVFNAALDTKEEGVYRYSRGTVSLIARSGTDIPGLGTIFSLEQGNSIVPNEPPLPAGFPAIFLVQNDRGQVAFVATLKDARIALLLATPSP